MKQYYYCGTDGQQYGPVPEEYLKTYGVTRDTLVWCEGMDNWVKAGDVLELSYMFATSTPPPLMPVPPQTPPAAPTTERCPDNYLAWSIITTLLCCWPFGIPAIVNAAKVENLWAQGDREGARERSKSAKTWCWVSFGCAIGFWVLYVILIACGVFAADALSGTEEFYYY